MTQTHETGDSLPAVLLLHGLGLNAWAMKRVEWTLRRKGYRVINASYDSRWMPLERLASDWLPAMLSRHRAERAPELHVVAHSMGGIITRLFLSLPERRPANLRRVVMLGPPNAGSELVDLLQSRWVFRVFTGVNGCRLCTDAETSLPRRLGPWTAPAELGIIAGDVSFNPLAQRIFHAASDGKVSVSSTQLQGMKQHLVVHHSHTWLQLRRSVIQRVVCFLETGHF